MRGGEHRPRDQLQCQARRRTEREVDGQGRLAPPQRAVHEDAGHAHTQQQVRRVPQDIQEGRLRGERAAPVAAVATAAGSRPTRPAPPVPRRAGVTAGPPLPWSRHDPAGDGLAEGIGDPFATAAVDLGEPPKGQPVSGAGVAHQGPQHGRGAAPGRLVVPEGGDVPEPLDQAAVDDLAVAGLFLVVRDAE